MVLYPPSRLLLVLLAGLGLMFALVTSAVVARTGHSPRPQPIAAQADPGGMTVLLLGVDARPGEAIDIGVRPDALMVLHVDDTTGACRLLSIPRDARVEVPGVGMTKINHALSVGGVALQRETVANLLGIPIDRYGLIDFAAFETLIDAVGGVEVTVAVPFTLGETSFAAGPQTLDGASALAYVRYRGGPDGDLGRIARQQEVIRATVNRINPLVIPRLAALLPVLAGNIRTDLSAAELTSLALRYLDSCRPDQIEVATLTGPTEVAWDPLLETEVDYIAIDPADRQAKVAALIGPGK